MMMTLIQLVLMVLFVLSACTRQKPQVVRSKSSPTKQASFQAPTVIKEVNLPFKPKTRFYVSQGAFGKNSHSEPGNEYSWDFDVPYDTEVVAADAGRVIDVWEPNEGGLCDESFSNLAHNIKIEHKDGTVAQYVHIRSQVEVGDVVNQGQVIAKTAQNGFICQPQLHFSVYQSRKHLYVSPNRKTLPLYFLGIPNGVAEEGNHYETQHGPSAR